MQKFLVKYAHKYAQKSTKICKNVLKYALNMQKIIFNKMSLFNTNFFLLILWVLISFTKKFFTLHSNWVKCKMWLCRKILSKYFNISIGVVRSLQWGPRGLAVRLLLQMQMRSWVRIAPRAKFVFHILLYKIGMWRIVL